MLWGKKTPEKSRIRANKCSVYADSSPDPFDDPKVETIVEIFKRIWVSLGFNQVLIIILT